MSLVLGSSFRHSEDLTLSQTLMWIFRSVSLSPVPCPVAGCRDAASRADATSMLVVALHWGAPCGHLQDGPSGSVVMWPNVFTSNADGCGQPGLVADTERQQSEQRIQLQHQAAGGGLFCVQRWVSIRDSRLGFQQVTAKDEETWASLRFPSWFLVWIK